MSDWIKPGAPAAIRQGFNRYIPVTIARVTKSQAVVDAKGSPYRFWLKDMREVGSATWGGSFELIPADDPRIERDRLASVALERRRDVRGSIEVAARRWAASPNAQNLAALREALAEAEALTPGGAE